MALFNEDFYIDKGLQQQNFSYPTNRLYIPPRFEGFLKN